LGSFKDFANYFSDFYMYSYKDYCDEGFKTNLKENQNLNLFTTIKKTMSIRLFLIKRNPQKLAEYVNQ